jgi:purine-binding chemotaxis protein CheW
MAKRTTRVAEQDADADPAASDGRITPETAGAVNLIVFQLRGGKFAFRLSDVREVVRMPKLARMPLAPGSLLGLANLNGVILPVVDLGALLGLAATALADAMVIVVGAEAPVGFVVDRIERLAALTVEAIGDGKAIVGTIDSALLNGVVRGGEGESSTALLDPQRLLREKFGRLAAPAPQRVSGTQGSIIGMTETAVQSNARTVSLISFELGTQEYALPLERVREIVQLPAQVAEVARSEAAVVGVVTLRDSLLPLVSLRSLLGLPPAAGETGKVVVLPLGGGVVGVVADRTREILHVDQAAIDPAPALLTRGEGDAEIASVCRLEGGRRLVAILSPDRLFRPELMDRLVREQAAGVDDRSGQKDVGQMASEQFIIFRLGDQEYGLPIAAVDEIARPPERIARMPKAPSFVDGVMNLRGQVTPIIDLRRRFDIASLEATGGQRILVLSFNGAKTGFVVDAVSEVLRIPEDQIRPAPEVSEEQMRLIHRVANLDAAGRMILLVDPAQLLDRIEADVLAKFGLGMSEQKSKAS